MRLTYRQIEYVREVARHKSITAASRSLSISQSSVLAAINVAEEITGTTLFSRRKGHGIELTPAGQKFLLSARKFLAAGEEFGRSLVEFSEPTTPTLRLGCFSPFGALLVPPVLKRYVDANGECEIVLREGDQVQLRSWLASGDIDLVVTYDIGEEYAGSVTPICKFPAHALLNKSDPNAGDKSISMDVLARKPHILLDLPETRAYLLALFDFAGQRPKISLRTRSYETIRSAVASGLGASMLNIRPAHISPDTDNLVRIPISDKLRQPTLMVADPYGDHKPQYVRAFINILYEYFLELGPKNFAVVMPEFARDLIYPRPNL